MHKTSAVTRRVQVFIDWPVHDDVIKWKHFPRYCPFVRGIHRSPVNSPHKGQWGGALMFSLICVWINGWVNNREAGDLIRYRAHYDVTVMSCRVCEAQCSWHVTQISMSGTVVLLAYTVRFHNSTVDFLQKDFNKHITARASYVVVWFKNLIHFCVVLYARSCYTEACYDGGLLY